MKVDVYKPTQDDWYGSFMVDNGYQKEMAVLVSFLGNISAPGEEPTWRTCVWGTDDIGMEFDADTETKAWVKFLEVIGWEYVNGKDLKNIGFVAA